MLYPTCAGIKFKLLEITEVDVFITKFSSFIKSYYRSGKPSIFKEIKNNNQGIQIKTDIIENLNYNEDLKIEKILSGKKTFDKKDMFDVTNKNNIN